MKYICIFFFILLSNVTFGQYQFLPLESNSNWVGYLHIEFANPGIFWIEYETKDQNFDTIINNEMYSKLYRNDLYHCAFRSDSSDKAIYVIPKDSLNEHLFFDFDITYTAGDTISLLYYNESYSWLNSEAVVYSIDSVLFNGQYYKSYNLEALDNIQNVLTYYPIINITERILSSSFPFSIIFEFESSFRRQCYSEYDSISIGNCPFTYDDFNILLKIDEVSVISNIAVYPNPSGGFFNIKNDKSTNEKIMIYNVSGQLIFSFIVDGNSTMVIDIKFDTGLYFLKTDNAKGSQVLKLVVNN